MVHDNCCPECAAKIADVHATIMKLNEIIEAFSPDDVQKVLNSPALKIMQTFLPKMGN